MVDQVQSDVRTEPDAFSLGKSYSVAQAARLARTSPQTVRRWLLGYGAPGHSLAPVLGRDRSQSGQPLSLSFLELIEIIVVARFRQGSRGTRPVPLDRLRQAHAYARERFGLPYPFASLRLREWGGHILHEFDAANPGTSTLALDRHGQWVLPYLVDSEIEHVDYEGLWAQRWFPAGREIPLVVDPHLAGGRPTILGTGVTVDTIRQRFAAGESIEFLAQDFEVPSSAIEQALRFANAA